MSKSCQRCSRPPIEGERFCLTCRDLLIREMEESGYLEPKPDRYSRPDDAREDTSETKFGPDEWTEGIRYEEFVERA